MIRTGDHITTGQEKYVIADREMPIKNEKHSYAAVAYFVES
jgi:hypothetical protein